MQLETKDHIVVDVTFKAPYHPCYGLVNVIRLQHLASPQLCQSIFQPIEDRAEVRGLPAIEGVCVGVSHLERLAEALQLRIKDSHVERLPNIPFDQYSAEDWYFLAPNESSELYPVNRISDMVDRASDPSFNASLSSFLKTHFHPGHRHHALTSFDPTLTDLIEGSQSLTHSCGGPGLDSMSDSRGVRFSTRRPADEAIEPGETCITKRARTEAWTQSMNRRTARG